jgi:hypothetical protein
MKTRGEAMNLKFRDLQSKLRSEGKAWLRKLERFDRRDEYAVAQNLLNDVGEEAFLRNWEMYRDRLDELHENPFAMPEPVRPRKRYGWS